MRASSILFALAALTCSWSVQAQTPSPAANAPQAVQDLPNTPGPVTITTQNGAETEQIIPGDRSAQQIERIEVKDKGATINELRVGGQTQSITVQPNAPVPSYSVQPADSQGDVRLPSQGVGSTGPRQWKLFGF